MAYLGKPGPDRADTEITTSVRIAPTVPDEIDFSPLQWHDNMSYLSFLLILSLGLNTTTAASLFSTDHTTPAHTVPEGVADQAIQRFKLADGVSVEDAVDSMKLRANQRNFKLVAELPLSEQVRAMGHSGQYIHILAFCDALTASRMVQYNLLFAAFLPCRISVVTDAEGQGWLVTMNIDQILSSISLPPELQTAAQQVRDTIHSIIDAGVNGDL